MARGWESKSVEEQQSISQPPNPSQSAPRQAATSVSHTLRREALELQRDRILDERTSSPIRRKALAAALADIEAKLAAL